MYRRLHKTILISITAAILVACEQPSHLPQGDTNNGGLLLPKNFEALVVVDSIGPARHLAVNDNGDIYVKLTYNDAMNGAGGTVGLRDLNKDGRADSVVYFGDYKDEGSLAAGITIHGGYLYTSTVRQVLRNKVNTRSSKNFTIFSVSAPILILLIAQYSVAVL